MKALTVKDMDTIVTKSRFTKKPINSRNSIKQYHLSATGGRRPITNERLFDQWSHWCVLNKTHSQCTRSEIKVWRSQGSSAVRGFNFTLSAPLCTKLEKTRL